MDFPADDPLLYERLEEALPEGCNFIFNHISTPPTPCDPLYTAPPGKQPELTFRETQFLSVSIDVKNEPSDSDADASKHGRSEYQVYGLEVMVFSTKRLTTVFVSKVDSTGHLKLLNLPKHGSGVFKTITSIFLRYLIENRQRQDTRLVLSLFARAAHEYLFPGSSESAGKRSLGDRKLIKWWCQVVDAVLAPNAPVPAVAEVAEGISSEPAIDSARARGFLRVPGFDAHGTASFFPKAKDGQSDLTRQRWTVGDPLRELGLDPNLPERCLIPRFPDDPKCRFLIDLDDELPDPENQVVHKPAVAGHDGRWNSVKSLDEFWEAMSWRQECSAGRAVGFIWGLFEPSGLNPSVAVLKDSSPPSAPQPNSANDTLSPQIRAQVPAQATAWRPHSSQQSPGQASEEESTEVCIAGYANDDTSHVTCNIPHETDDYYWPFACRGTRLMGQVAYDEIHWHLSKQDYSTKSKAGRSSCNWSYKVAETAQTSGGESFTITGQNASWGIAPSEPPDDPLRGAVSLGSGLIRKKSKRPREDEDEEEFPTKKKEASKSLPESYDYDEMAERTTKYRKRRELDDLDEINFGTRPRKTAPAGCGRYELGDDSSNPSDYEDRIVEGRVV